MGTQAGPEPDPGRGTLRDRLLDQYTPAGGKFEAYQKEVRAMLDKNERGLRREKWVSALLWCYAVFMVTTFSLAFGYWAPKPWGGYLSAALALMFLALFAAVELLKHFINRSRVELLKELKGIELRLMAIEERGVRGGERPA